MGVTSSICARVRKDGTLAHTISPRRAQMSASCNPPDPKSAPVWSSTSTPILPSSPTASSPSASSPSLCALPPHMKHLCGRQSEPEDPTEGQDHSSLGDSAGSSLIPPLIGVTNLSPIVGVGEIETPYSPALSPSIFLRSAQEQTELDSPCCHSTSVLDLVAEVEGSASPDSMMANTRELLSMSQKDCLQKGVRDAMKKLYVLYRYFATRSLFKVGWVKCEELSRPESDVVVFSKESESPSSFVDQVIECLVVSHIHMGREMLVRKLESWILRKGFFGLSPQSAPCSSLYSHLSKKNLREMHLRFFRYDDLRPYIAKNVSVPMLALFAMKTLDDLNKASLSPRPEDSDSNTPEVIQLFMQFAFDLPRLGTPHNHVVRLNDGTGCIVVPVGHDTLFSPAASCMLIRCVSLTAFPTRGIRLGASFLQNMLRSFVDEAMTFQRWCRK